MEYHDFFKLSKERRGGAGCCVRTVGHPGTETADQLIDGVERKWFLTSALPQLAVIWGHALPLSAPPFSHLPNNEMGVFNLSPVAL